MKTIWGIDLGGTKVEGVVLDEQFNVIARERVATEQTKGYEHIVGQIGKLVHILIEQTGFTPARIGMGTPGTLDPTSQTIKNSNTVVLNGKKLKADVERALNVPFVFANDANCFALAEAKMGIVPEKCPNAQVVFGVIMGTGTGGGLVVNGKIINGKQGIGGEWGHNYLDESGGPCYCGKTGCVERVISGTGLQRFYTELTNEKRNLKEIIQRHHQGIDPAASQTFNRLMTMFGKAVSVLINILDPDVIVLGGGVGNIPELYTEGVAKINEFIFNDKVETLFLKPKLGDSAGVFGAAMLVSE